MSYTVKGNDHITCILCPKACRIAEGEEGTCGVRFNKKGLLDLPFYGILSALNVDPIEKKPLYHFFPGSVILSAGFYGCSFHCPFCQNFQISQQEYLSRENKYVSPEALIHLVQEKGLSSIAFTYSEPLVHFEYILEASRIAHEKGIKTVLVTNGYINKKPAKELLPVIDALNIDLKSFSDSFYTKELGGTLKPVMDFVIEAAAFAHVEITTLIIPGKNDSNDEIRKTAHFIASINRKIPYHLSAYYPAFHYQIQPTSENKISSLIKSAREYLDFVYPGNTANLDNNTYCSYCGSLLVKRNGYRTTLQGITDNTCTKCGNPLPFQV